MKKFALIIGGSSGMGLATAHKLSASGYSLVIIHRDRRSVLAAFQSEVNAMRENGVEVFTHNMDATNKENVADFCNKIDEQVKELGFSLVLHAVSRGNLKSLISEKEPMLSDEDVLLTIDAMAVNLLTWVRSLFECKLLAVNARVISLTSAGSSKYWPGYGAVAMAKSSLEILTKYLAVEMAPYNVRVNAINAGVTDTASLKFIPGYDALVSEAGERNPLGRMTEPADVANVVYLLSTPEANWINGSVINVDGGETLV